MPRWPYILQICSHLLHLSCSSCGQKTDYGIAVRQPSWLLPHCSLCAWPFCQTLSYSEPTACPPTPDGPGDGKGDWGADSGGRGWREGTERPTCSAELKDKVGQVYPRSATSLPSPHGSSTVASEGRGIRERHRIQPGRCAEQLPSCLSHPSCGGHRQAKSDRGNGSCGWAAHPALPIGRITCSLMPLRASVAVAAPQIHLHCVSCGAP
uniref:Secreted protein n=1 Tax=Micrurus corallinus TaxID=54390 RepID=A0A2D4GIS1_MICCO